jgi:hypothetical protein
MIFFLTLLSPDTTGYKIDESCIKEGAETLVRDGMILAFEMVDAALNRLGEKRNDPHTLELLGWSFGKEDKDPKQLDMGKTQQVLSDIVINYRDEVRGEVSFKDIVC